MNIFIMKFPDQFGIGNIFCFPYNEKIKISSESYEKIVSPEMEYGLFFGLSD